MLMALFIICSGAAHVYKDKSGDIFKTVFPLEANTLNKDFISFCHVFSETGAYVVH